MSAHRLLVSTIIPVACAFLYPQPLRAEDEPSQNTLQELHAAAEEGNVDALFLLGKAYWHGKGAPKDQSKAVDYYRRAAEKNHGDALAGLGAAYGLGQGVEKKDIATAATYFRRAAEQGSAIGQMNLGKMLIVGESLERNPEEGLRWLSAAAEHGFVKAQVYLGELYLVGDAGVPRDYAKASTWFRRAIDQDDARALNSYGVMLRDGLGNERDPVAAVTYFRRAAEKGSLRGFLNLGSAYFHGQGVELDKITGMSWWFAGEELGDGACRETAARLIGGINPEDVRKARELGKKMAHERLTTVIKHGLRR